VLCLDLAGVCLAEAGAQGVDWFQAELYLEVELYLELRLVA